MDYSKIYIELIERSFDRSILEYTEDHHIIPKCMGGDSKSRNIAKLTAEEHYLAHQLLVKIYPDNKKLLYAANMMSMNANGNRGNNKLYGWLRRKLSESQIGKIVTEETRKRQSLAKLGRTFSKETKDKMSKSRMGSKRSIEVKKKMSEIRKGIEFTQEHCDNISKSKSGVKFHTGHSRAAISESLKGRIPWNKGKSMSEDTKLKISNNLKGRNTILEHKLNSLG